MDRIALPAPAKINLGLRIRGRRADGYHLLESLFLPVDLADEVEVSEAPAFALDVVGPAPGVPSGEGNLAARAVRAFCRAAGLPEGFRVRLRKRIPAAGGLGGGSSDAAAVLRALVRLRPGVLTAQDLRALALRLGADVPFFLDPRPALVEGVGEQILPLIGVPSLSLVLAHPGIPLATADVYRAYDAAADSLTPGGAVSTLRRLLDLRTEDGSARTHAFELTVAGARSEASSGKAGPRSGGRSSRGTGSVAGLIRELIVNDLESAAVRLCASIGGLRREIQATGPIAVGMTGSGPTVFGVYADEEAAREAERRLQSTRAREAPDTSSSGAGAAPAGPEGNPHRPRTWVARTVSSSGPGLTAGL